MGILDSLFQNAPGIIAKGLAGQQAGQDAARQQQQQDEDRQRAIQLQALHTMLLSKQVDAFGKPKPQEPKWEKLVNKATGAVTFYDPVNKQTIADPNLTEGVATPALQSVDTVNPQGKKVTQFVRPTEGAQFIAPPPAPDKGSWTIRDVPGEAPVRINSTTGQVLPYAGPLKPRDVKPTNRQELARGSLPPTQAANDEYEQLYNQGGPLNQGEIRAVQNLFHQATGKPTAELKNLLLTSAGLTPRARQMGVDAFELAYNLGTARGRAAAQTISDHVVAILSNEKQRKNVLIELHQLAGTKRGTTPQDDLNNMPPPQP